jgi:hypothetical protein
MTPWPNSIVVAFAGALASPGQLTGTSIIPWWGYVLIGAAVVVAIVLVAGVLVSMRRRPPAPAVPRPEAAEAPTAAVPAPPTGPAPPPPPDPPALVFKAGPLAGRRVEVRHELVLGRENVDVLIEDPVVSRRHASVRPVEGRLEIVDLGSSNGTFVNGVRLRDIKVLEAGDEIRLGGISLRVEVPARVQPTVVVRDPNPTVVSGDAD